MTKENDHMGRSAYDSGTRFFLIWAVVFAAVIASCIIVIVVWG
jgi:hypothetical protein